MTSGPIADGITALAVAMSIHYSSPKVHVRRYNIPSTLIRNCTLIPLSQNEAGSHMDSCDDSQHWVYFGVSLLQITLRRTLAKRKAAP